MATRNLQIDGFDPDIIQGFEIDTIRPDAIPNRIINAVRLALADGQKLVGAAHVDKRITVSGHFWAGTRANYEIARDKLLGVFDPEAVISMEFEQSGEQRRYYGTYENMQFDYKDNGFCMVTILFKCTDPFGYTIAESMFYSNASVTDEMTYNFESGGNIYGLTKIVAKITDIDSTILERTLSFTISQGVKSYNIQVKRLWKYNDTVTVDSVKQKVYVNGLKVEHVGRWPQVFKMNTFRFNIPEAATFDVNLKGTYNKRWL